MPTRELEALGSQQRGAPAERIEREPESCQNRVEICAVAMNPLLPGTRAHGLQHQQRKNCQPSKFGYRAERHRKRLRGERASPSPPAAGRGRVPRTKCFAIRCCGAALRAIVHRHAMEGIATSARAPASGYPRKRCQERRTSVLHNDRSPGTDDRNGCCALPSTGGRACIVFLFGGYQHSAALPDSEN